MSVLLRRRAAAAFVAVALVGVGAASGASAFTTRQELWSFDGSYGTEPPAPVLADAVDNSAGRSAGDVYVGLASTPGSVLKFNAYGQYTEVALKASKTPARSFSLEKAPFTSGIAVDSSESENAGDVYVADIAHGVVDKFSEKGKYLCQITGAATPSASECNGKAGSETPNGSIVPRGVAVDSKGDVYVADVEHGVIDEFAPSGEYLKQLVDPQPDPGALAVSASGDVYVANGEGSMPLGVVELEPDGNRVARPELEGARAVSVAVDPGSGDVLVGEPLSGISEFTAEGQRVVSFGAGGYALAPATAGFVYANASTEPTITVYGGLETNLPEVRVEAASGVSAGSATLNGEVTPEPHSKTSECEFEYGPTSSYSYSERGLCEPLAGGGLGYTEATSVSATVAVSPSTKYHFRIRAKDQGTEAPREAHSTGGTFETPGLEPVAPVIADEAANPSVTTASVRAQIAPGGSHATSCRVQFVQEAQFRVSAYADAASVPCSPPGVVGEGFEAQRALAALEGLRAGTTYHYRFVASNEKKGESVGEDATFATFGIHSFSAQVLDREGEPYTQAGGHPYKLVTNVEFNVGSDITGHRATDANPEDIITALPPGYIGDVNATPRCTFAELVQALCTRAAQVGVMRLRLDSEEDVEPLYNLVPPEGYPAALGFRVSTFTTISIDFSLRTGGDYGIDAEALDSSTSAGLQGATVEVWGVPADPGHDHERDCLPPGDYAVSIGNEECPVTEPLLAFLTDPTSCTGPQSETLRADSWQDPEDFVTATTTLPEITGCSSVPFTPKVSVAPTSSSADSPTGLVTELELPVQENPELLEQSELERTVVKLPAGMTVSPSGANGLEACSPEQIALDSASEPRCPKGSRLGGVEIQTPVLPSTDKVTGSVYLAQQNHNPFGSTLALYLYAHAVNDAGEPQGAVIKLAGHVEANPLTGQLTTTFAQTPQLPFSSLKLILEEGPRAALATPESCGTFATETSLTPWNGLAAVSFAPPFEVTSGCGAAFAPSFTAGSTSAQAGAYSPLMLSFSREDGEQELSKLTATLPAGLAAKLAGVPLCSEAAAAGGACPEESRVGSVTAYAGPGTDPLMLHGSAYLTGPYNGAPYGMAVEVPAIAGPFNLGTVTVRQALYVDPHDAHVTAVSDPFPTILDVTGANGQTDGLPVRLRRVDVSIDRPDFTFNPTSCEAKAIAAAFTSTSGASASRTAPFQVANCQGLPFDPVLSASAAGQGSKANGTTFTVNVSSGGLGAGGVGQAGIAKVDLQLPTQLPSRLSTLQKACLAATFEANPASCQEGSVIGAATIHTPILASPLTGPGYLVSYGGAAFPDVEFVLQGDGITLILDGKTDIKNGITYSKFESTPDAPFTTFETELPAGPHSALSANVPEDEHYNLCKQTLTMPTTIVGQNGKTIEQNTPIAITGCTGVLSAKTHKPSLKQKLTKALAKCRAAYKHNHSKRAACERKAHTTYTHIALAQCRNTNKHTPKKRAACEAHANRAYPGKAAKAASNTQHTNSR